MFTGLIQAQGQIKELIRSGQSARIKIGLSNTAWNQSSAKYLFEAEIGSSIAVNGTCLTVRTLYREPWMFDADMMEETLKVSSLGQLARGALVNLESALRLGQALDGHLVSGDIDARCKVEKIRQTPDLCVYTLAPEDRETMRWIVLRGRVSIDGASLTVMERTDRSFSVSLIPHTRERIILGQARVGQVCNLETDLIMRQFFMAKEFK